MFAIYDEVEQRFGNDTLNEYYAEILRERAKAAEAQNQPDDANRYWQRYNKLEERLHIDLLQNKANLYAARFQAQRQQREIEQQREATRQAEKSRTVIGVIALLILLLAFYAVRQWRKTQQRNRILAQQITEAVEYKDKYNKLKRSIEAEGSEDLKSPTHDSQIADSAERTVSEPQVVTANLAELSDAVLFAYLRDLIEREQLFLNPLFERQTLIERTGLTKERIGAAFSQGSDHGRLTTLVSELRLDYAVRLMNEDPESSIEKVCQASGFSNANTFTRSFKAKYDMTPSAYRATLGQ